jgi:hypothetical protein
MHSIFYFTIVFVKERQNAATHMHPVNPLSGNAPWCAMLILLNLSNSKRNFTCQGESAATQQVNFFILKRPKHSYILLTRQWKTFWDYSGARVNPNKTNTCSHCSSLCHCNIDRFLLYIFIYLFIYRKCPDTCDSLSDNRKNVCVWKFWKYLYLYLWTLSYCDTVCIQY